MAGKTKRMSQIKQLLLLLKQGRRKKEIARILDMSKNTVKSYLEKLSMCKQSIESLINMSDPELERIFHAGNPAYCDNRFDVLRQKLDYYEKEYQRQGVTQRLLWEEYHREHPEGYGKTQFSFHLMQHIASRHPSMVLDHQAGEKLYVDFAGKPMQYIERKTGEVVSCPVFVACLPYSDYSFVLALKSQRVEDFIYALKCCLEDLGGVPKVLVSDNLKSAIIKSSKYEPTINQVLEDFGNHYGIAIIPTRTYKPKDKALVENQVKMIYTRIYARLRNETFFDLESLNNAIKEKTRDHNQTRMQQKPYSREECFLSNEKSLLTPLPLEDFEIKYYLKLKVAKNNHIYLARDKHYYSVPYIYIGQISNVIYTRSMVYIYISGKQAAVHQRSYTQGKYSTCKEHLCSHHQHYLDRSPDYYIEKARKTDETFHLLIKALFTQNRHPEQLYRVCDGLISLQRKTDQQIFTSACQIALANENYSYHFVFNLIKNKMTESPRTEIDKPLPKHQNIRGKEYYIQYKLNL